MENYHDSRVAATSALTQDILAQYLSYDRDTGHFTRVRSSGSQKAGDIAGCLHKHLGYWVIKVQGISHYAHRLAYLAETGSFPTAHVDHINCIRSDNRWTNLRPATPAENNQNMVGYANSGYKHISIYDTAKFGIRYRVKISRDGERRSAVFGDLDQAIDCRDAWIKALDGAFANVSHINDITD